MTPLEVGIIGAGGIVVQRHLPGLRKSSSVEIVAVANSRLESAQAFCSEHAPEARPMKRWEDVATLPEADIIWIGASPFLHKPATLAALAAGKHVFCQARMAMNLADAEEMLAAAKARPDLVTMLCPPPHGLRGNAFIRHLLAEGTLGEIRSIHLRSLNGAFLDPATPAHWRQKIEISGSNIMTLGIHTEVIQRWLGDFTVTGAEGRVYIPERHGYRVQVPDALNVLTRFANGAMGLMEFSGVHPGEAVEALDICGSKGLLRYDYNADVIRLLRSGSSEWETLTIPANLEGGWWVESDFIHAVRNPHETRPHPDFTDGVRYMRVVQQVSDLLEERGVV